VNSKVILTVGTPGAALRDVTVQREAIGDAFSTNTITVQALDNGIVHVAFPPSYYNTLVLDLTLALRDLNSQDKLKGLILDLRASSNGNTWSIDTTVFLLDLFSTSARGEIYTRDSVSPITLDNLESRWTLVPLVILVGPDTRGGPEIFAATMQASRGTRLFGLPTPGEVEGWETLTLPDGSALTLVTTSFRTAFGDEIGVTGLRPDKLIEADWDSLSPTHDPVLDAAWEYLNGR
jgi:C-terminal processing protease CtpA/Prc